MEEKDARKGQEGVERMMAEEAKGMAEDRQLPLGCFLVPAQLVIIFCRVRNMSIMK